MRKYEISKQYVNLGNDVTYSIEEKIDAHSSRVLCFGIEKRTSAELMVDHLNKIEQEFKTLSKK